MRQFLRTHGLTFQRTKTWKESNDPLRDVKLARIDEVLIRFSGRCFAFDEFGLLTIRLSAHKGTKIREWTDRNKVELCFTPTYASWLKQVSVRACLQCHSSYSTLAAMDA